MIYGIEEITSYNTITKEITHFKAICGRNKYNEIYILRRV